MFIEKCYVCLKWVCCCGMLELDVLLQFFVEEVFYDFFDQDQEIFECLFICDDLDLFVWFMGY